MEYGTAGEHRMNLVIGDTSSMNEMPSGLLRVIADVAEVSEYIWEKEWTSANGGNISCDVTDALPDLYAGKSDNPSLPTRVSVPSLGGRSLLITVSGSRFRDVRRHPELTLMLVRISADGTRYKVLWGGECDGAKPTLEFIPHLKIHNDLRATGHPHKAIVHTHPIHLIAATHTKEFGTAEFATLLQVSQSTAKVFLSAGVGMIGYLPGGSETLADETVRLLRSHSAVLWDRHGCVATGKDVFEGFDTIHMLEKAAEMFLLCRASGIEPKQMTGEELKSIGL